MKVATLKQNTRAKCRESLAAVLRMVPNAALDPLRAAFPETVPASVGHVALNGVLNLVRYQGIPSGVETFKLTDNPEVTLVRADSFVTERAYWFGERYGYEPGGVYWWRYFCSRSAGILELGANVGYYTVQGGRVAPSTTYTAVEPHPGCAATCRRNVDINSLMNVNVIEAAAVSSLVATHVTLRLPGGQDHYTGAPSTGFVGRNEVHVADAEDPRYQELTVPAVELRSLLENVDLFKLDVEGQEYELLASISNELVSMKPTIFVELLDDTPKLHSLVAELCSRHGYRCFVPTVGRLVPLSLDGVLSRSVRARSATRDVVLTCDPTL